MVSTLIGYIEPDQQKRTVQFENNDEGFIVLRCDFKGIQMDLLVSEYIYSDNTGYVQIEGSYCTIAGVDDTGKKVHMPCIYAQNITSLSEKAELTNEVKFRFRLTKVHKYLVTQNGLEILFAYGTIINSFGSIEVCKICLKGALARQYKNSTRGTEFTATAFLKAYGKGVEFLINTVLV